MHKSIEKLAYKITEAVQGDQLVDNTDKINIYHRKVTAHTSADLAYTNGVVASGLRATALFSAAKNSGNFSSFQSSLRQHLPLVINLDKLDGSMRAFEGLSCFVFVAASPQEHLNLLILAQKVTELSLVPGFVVANYGEDETKVDLPADELLKKYLGNPDDQIETPTAAQKIIFGRTRRRVPNWFSLDIPVMLGTNKDEQARFFETMASEKYFFEHLQDIITRAVAEFKAVFGSDIQLVAVEGKKSKEVIVANNRLVFEAYNALNSKKPAQLIKLSQVQPFPAEALDEALEKATSVTFLEQSDLGGTTSITYQHLAKLLTGRRLYAGRLGGTISSATLEAIELHMREGKEPREYFVELQFTKAHSSFPKHEILLQEINKQYPALKNASLGQNQNQEAKQGKLLDIPVAIREHQDKGPNYSKLAGFYDNIAFFYQQNERHELVADPFAAMPLTPAGSAGFFNSVTERSTIPHFRPAKCTGCGECLVNCPHAALPAIVIGVEQLMRAGMELASAKGHKLLKLTPMLKNLAKLASQAIGDKPENLADFLPEAFASLCSQMKLEDENLEAAQNEFDLVMAELKSLPTAITETFFQIPEKSAKGSGEIFAVAFNPDTCTGCGICSDSCPEEAINMVDEDENLITEARATFDLWQVFPGVAEVTLDRLNETGDYNSLATIMLDKDNYSSMIGGSLAESNNAYKTLIHLVTAAANGLVAPKRKSLVEQISSLVEAISEKVHDNLSDALPRENLEALSQTLKETRTQKASFHEIVDRLEEVGQQKMVDTRALQRMTNLVDDLKELRWVLTTGPTGVGRANFGLYLSGSDKMSWAQEYPLNNFAAPSVVQWQGSAPEQVLGLTLGHIRHQIDNLKLIRRAELEAAGKYDPAAHDLEIAALDWDKLSIDERNAIPPILVIGDREDLNSSGWQSLNKLLSTDYPVKVILLDHIAPPSKHAIENLTQSYTGLLNAITLKKAFVYQGSMSDPEHLAKGLNNGLIGAKPALLNLFAFNEEQHDGDARKSLAYAHLAVNSRTFPMVYFNPDKEHGFLNGTIDLEANHDTREDWVSEDMPLPNEETLAYKVTWADWAYTQEAWQSEFKRVSQDGNNVVMAEYVKLSAKDRANKIPVIIRASAQGLVYYSASRHVVRMSEAVLDNWNTLQELAGLITEFPVKLSEEVKKELANKYTQDVADLKQEYEEKMQQQEQEFMSKMRVQIKERLVQLSKMARN